MSGSAVRLSAVRKTYGELIAVNSLDLDIPSGGFFSIIGPSGCGKTSTLRMIAGLEEVDSGTIEVGGKDLTHVRAHRRPVNTVFQSYALFPHLNVNENIAFGLVEERRPRDEIRRRVTEMNELMHLVGRERSKPTELSGGQQQRVALARALIKHPAVLLLDEPLGALDLKLRRELQRQLKSVQRRVGISFVHVTHDQEEAFSMSDQVAVMNGGVLEQVGTPEEVYRRPATLFVAEFVGSANRLEATVIGRGDRGLYRLAISSGGVIEAAGPNGLREGLLVSVIVRPEEVRLDDSGLAAVVLDVAYMGPARHISLEGERLGTLRMTVPASVQPVSEGDRVRVSWPAESGWIIP